MAELSLPTQALLAEINDHKLTQKSVAKTYALALQASAPTDWGMVNRAIVSRWSLAVLVRIKNAAWTGRWSGSPLFDEVPPSVTPR